MKELLLFWVIASIGYPTLSLGWTVEEFTRSPSEHIINEIEKPFVVRSVVGAISRAQGDRGPLPNVIFEIQGPGTDPTIRRTMTDEHGKLKMKHVPAGEYRFKATLDGFQSMIGKIVVSKTAASTEKIRIEMPVGT